MKRLEVFAGPLFIVAAVGIVEVLCLSGTLKPIYVAAPTVVWGVLLAQIQSGSVWPPFAATLLHVLIGWATACVLGIVLGAAIARSEGARLLLGPSLNFMRPLPASALVPAAILLFGPNASTVLIVTIFGSIWPILLSSVKGFESVDARLIETSRMLRFGAIATFWKFTLPSAVSDVIAGARVALAIALIVAVVSEMLTSVTGLGNNIVLAARSYNMADLYAGIVLLALIGIASNGVMEVVESRWRRRYTEST